MTDNCIFYFDHVSKCPVTNNIQIDDNKKADILNKYFTEISTIEDAGIDVPEFAVRTENTIDFIEIHQQDIVDILKSLKLNKAVGLDNISHHILRNTAETISLPLLKLFQMCLQ